MKEENRCHRKSEDYKRILWKEAYQDTGQPRRRIKSLESYNFLRLNHEEGEISNRPIANTETEKVILKLKKKKKNPQNPGPHSFTGELYQTLKDYLKSILFKLFPEIEKKEKFPNILQG